MGSRNSDCLQADRGFRRFGKPHARVRRTGDRRKRTAAVPGFVNPQLATLVETVPQTDDWLHEVKYDGYRLQAVSERNGIRLLSRNGLDWTDRLPGIAAALSHRLKPRCVVDGEAVMFDAEGQSDFSALQKAISSGGGDAGFVAFDLLVAGGEDIRTRPLEDRKSRLDGVLSTSGVISKADHIVGDGAAVIASACRLNLEGIISKKRTAPYVSGRTKNWLKCKCINTDDFVLGGYRKSEVRGRPFSSLLIGEMSEEGLVYRGRVGAGFSKFDLDELSQILGTIETNRSPFIAVPDSARRGAVWLEPVIRSQISFSEITDGGILRHPRYRGIRRDKTPTALTRDAATRTQPIITGRQAGGASLTVSGTNVSSADRVMDSKTGATKGDLARYLDAMASEMLRLLGGRPLSLVRCPDGASGRCFFQKNRSSSIPAAIEVVRLTTSGGERAHYMQIRSTAGLVAAVQMGTVELHLWGARSDRLERPERIVFDLDPDAALGFDSVRHAAIELRDVLDAAGLQSFPMVTGGKGIHVIAPIVRRYGWDTVKQISRGIARDLSAAAPDRYVAVMAKEKRTRRIFIDWMRNERGATAIAPFSPRARPGMPIATPLSWSELDEILSPNAFGLNATLERISRGIGLDQVWPGYRHTRQSLAQRLITRYVAD